jgi:hypothetical protein
MAQVRHRPPQDHPPRRRVPAAAAAAGLVRRMRQRPPQLPPHRRAAAAGGVRAAAIDGMQARLKAGGAARGSGLPVPARAGAGRRCGIRRAGDAE